VASGSLLLSEQYPGGKTDLSHPEKSLMLTVTAILNVSSWPVASQEEARTVEDLDSFLQFFLHDRRYIT
jgi:hypothetical protein